MSWFKKPSLVTRIAIGKLVGFVIGLLGFLLLWVLVPDGDPLVRLGVLFWYATVGAIIGVYGVFTWHPVLVLPMPWWVRAPMIGAWMNFVLTLFAFGTFESLMQSLFGQAGASISPWWFVLEGGLVGMLIGFMATKFGGEGRETLDEL